MPHDLMSAYDNVLYQLGSFTAKIYSMLARSRSRWPNFVVRRSVFIVERIVSTIDCFPSQSEAQCMK